MMRLKAKSASLQALTVFAVCAAMVMGGSAAANASEDPNVTSQEEVAVEAAPTSDAAPTQEQVAPAPAPAPESAPAPAPAPAPEPAPAPAPEVAPATETAPTPATPVEEAPAAPSSEKAPAVNTTTTPDQDDNEGEDEVWVAKSTLKLRPMTCAKEGEIPPLVESYDDDETMFEGESVNLTHLDGDRLPGDTEVRAEVGTHTYLYEVTNLKTGETQVKSGTFVVKACADEGPVVYTPPAPTFKQTDVCTEGGAPIVEVTIDEYDRTMGQYRLFGEPLDGPGVYTAPGTQIRVSFEFADGVTAGEGVSQWSYAASKDCSEATEPPFTLVLWIAVDSDGNGDIWEQRVVASLNTSSTDLTQLDGAATACGTYQVDLYKNSEATADLIAGGVLYGPNNPHEDFADIDGPKYRVFTVKDCVVTPPSGSEPTITDACGVDKDKVNVPANGANYAYVTTDHRVDGVGVVEVNLVANEGYRLPEGIKTHWEFDFTNEACPPVEEPEEPVNPEPQPPVTPVTPQEPAVVVVPAANNGNGSKTVKYTHENDALATTGGEAPLVSLLAGFGLLMAGGVLMAVRRRQRDA